MKPLRKSTFSSHFNHLVWMGGWLPETNNPHKKTFFLVYKLIFNVGSVIGFCGIVLDFVLVFGDLKKMVWNLCVSLLFMGAFTKMLQIAQRKETINSLRLKLHRNAESKDSPEYAPIHDQALKELRLLRVSLYGSATVFIPVWLVTRYFSQVRELPIPVHLPFQVDLEDEQQYAIAFVLAGSAGIFGIFFGVETEMAMFSILIQLSREYRLLIKDIPKLNELNGEPERATSVEVNPRLRRLKEQTMMKELSIRQREIIECTQAFEVCYTQPFLVQFFSISALIVLIALQCMLETVDVYGNLMYQMGYLSAITVNLFMICWFSTRLRLLCFAVGETAYFTRWYCLQLETQKDLVMMILRSQHPPKITTGKLMELNLQAFMDRVANICSWLILARELQFNMTQQTSS